MDVKWRLKHLGCLNIYIYIYIFFGRKRGYYLKETKVYITLVAALGIQSLVSPKAARSLIYNTSTKVGQCS